MHVATDKQILDRIRKVIERAFDSKAEAYSHIELANYFKRRELLPTLIHQREHHVIKGRKGTGKTAILLYLSLPVQVHCRDKSEEDFVGFYITFGANLAPQISFDPHTEEETALLFGHWFNLYACKAIVDSIATATSEGFQGIDAEHEKKFVTELWTSFLGISDSLPSSFKEASSHLDSFQKELRRLLSGSSSDKITNVAEYSSKRSKYRGRVTNVVAFAEIIEIMQRSMQPFRNKVVFILLDEYDNLSVAQQLVVNTAIAGSTGQYYAKIGVLSEQGLKSRKTLTGLILRDDQLKFVNLEHFASYKEYEDFVRAAIETRFTEIQKEVSKIPELKNLFVNSDKLIPAKDPSKQLEEQGTKVLQRRSSWQLSLFDMEGQHTGRFPPGTDSTDGVDIDGWWTLLKYGRQPTYCGIGTICLLSSGLIRSAIEIVYTILREALTTHWDVVRQTQCIPYDIQDSAIRQEGDYWLRTKLLADIKGRTWDESEPLADVAARLINNLLKRFSDTFVNQQNEPALNRFSLRELRDRDADGIRALREGGVAGIFTQIDESSISPKDAAVFALHRIYSVRNNLPPVGIGCLRLSWDKFEKYCRPPRGAITRKQDIETPYFFGIGFRKTWENKVRQELPDRSPPRYRYSDGAGAHDRSTLVVRTVEERIDAARLCIFDVTTQNENVCFEYGLALAKRKPIRHLLNRSQTQVRNPNRLIPLLRGIILEMYSFSDDPSEEELQSLKEAMEGAADWYEKYRKRRGNPCSLDAKCRFISPTRLNNQVFIAAPEGSLAQICFSDVRRLIREDLHLQVYPQTMNAGSHYICDFCQAAGRSKYCIIDTTSCDPTYCGVLGLAFGYRSKVLNIYEQNRPGLITNYAGQDPKEYADKEQLIHKIRTFLQASEVSQNEGN